MNYQTKIVGIIATNDLPVLLETAFCDDFMDDDNLESLLDNLRDKNVINYTPDFEVECCQKSVEELIAALPADYYFIAIETPIYHFFNGKGCPCYSWGYTQTTWVLVKSLDDIDKYRQMVGKIADETLNGD